MYNLEFTANGKTVKKTAKSINEVKRLIWIYDGGDDASKEAKYKQAITTPTTPTGDAKAKLTQDAPASEKETKV